MRVLTVMEFVKAGMVSRARAECGAPEVLVETAWVELVDTGWNRPATGGGRGRRVRRGAGGAGHPRRERYGSGTAARDIAAVLADTTTETR